MPRLSIPSEIVIEITGQCRLNCTYCTTPDARAAHMPLAHIRKTLNESARLKIPAIRFTGGEPLLHPDLRAALTYARQLGFYIIINTSAENIPPAQLRTLSSTVNCAFVSLQGYNQASSKAYTHSHTIFNEKLKNIFAIKALVPTLRLGTVITPVFNSAFPRFAALVEKISPVSWGLFRPISATDQDMIRMNNSFYKKLILNIIRSRRKGINVQIANAIPLCVSGNIRAGKECIAGAVFDDGHQRIVQDARGFFKPSYFISDNLGKSIRKAWAHPTLKEIDSTKHLPSCCQQCAVLNICLGGSRAMSLRSGGSVLAPDPLSLIN